MRLGPGTFARGIFPVVAACLALGAADPAGEPDPGPVARFADARVGLFIDWGVFTLLGKDPAVVDRNKLPPSEYEKLLPQFKPTAFSAEAWVKTAEAAGARYLAVTAKGPDGFCLFDSKHTSFDVVDATPFAKDPLKALAEACRTRRMPLVVEFSVREARRAEDVEGQVRELCTNYGPLAGVWFTGRGADSDLPGLARVVRKLQPGALVGTRGGSSAADVRAFPLAAPPAFDGAPGVTASGVADLLVEGGPAVELTLTVLPWGAGADFEVKARDRGAATPLVRSVAWSAGLGLNLRLGVVARADGSIDPGVSRRLAGLGRWLETHGEAVYGSRRGPVSPQPWGVSTRKPSQGGSALIYLHVFHPEGPLILPDAVVSLSARPLGGSKPLPIIKADGRALIDVPEDGRDPADTVIVLAPGVLDGLDRQSSRPRR